MKPLAFVSLVSLLAACSTSTPPEAPSAPPPVHAAPTPPPPPPPPAQAAPVVQQESPQQAFERMRAAVDGKSVYFDFDQSMIKSDQQAVVLEHAKLASTYARAHVRVEGNCDERGGREYNLGLGQRRADAIKKQLALLGVPETRIETVSLGKEKPRALCHAENCWAENRRADFFDSWR